MIDYYAGISPMRSWSGEFKAVVAFLTLFICIAADRISVSVLVFLSMAGTSVMVGKIPWKQYAAFFKIPAAFLLLGTAAIVIGVSGKPYGFFSVPFMGFYFYLAKSGLALAAVLVLKALAAVSAMYFLVLSTPVGEITAALYRLHVPNLILELMTMVYRFIFVMTDVHCRMRQAAASRLGGRDFKTACRSFESTAVSLLVVSLKRANACYDAMVSRGYDGELLFLEEEKKTDDRPKAAAAVYFAVLLAIWIWPVFH